MRISILLTFFLMLLLGCAEKAPENHSNHLNAIAPQPETFTEEEKKRILTKNVPATLLTGEYETELVLPFYYDYLDVYETDEIEEPWLWGKMATIESQPIKGVVIDLNGFLERQFRTEEEVFLYNSEVDDLVHISDIKEVNIYEDGTILYEDDNGIVYYYGDNEVYVNYFEYNKVDKTYLLYRAKLGSFSNLTFNERKKMAFELLRNAKNLKNYSLTGVDFRQNSWEDYANAQPNMATQTTIDGYKRLEKQVGIFMDPGEELKIKSNTENTLVHILRPHQEDIEGISNFLFALETGIPEDISKKRDNLSNAAQHFLGIQYGKEDISFQIDKRDITYQITMSYTNYNEEIKTNRYVISFLRKNDTLFFFRTVPSSTIQADYYTKLNNYYHRNGTLSYDQNR